MMKFLQFIGKKILILTTVLMFGNVFGQVPLPHYDGFNYATGDLGGKGSWINFNGTTGDRIQVGAVNLSYLGMPSIPGSKILFDGAGIDNAKSFTPQAVGFGTIYFSFLINVSNITNIAASTGGYQAGISDNATGFSSTLWLRPSSNLGFYNIGLGGKTAVAEVQWGADRSINTTYLVVVSLQSILGGVIGAGNDACKMWINPVYGAAEPSPTLSLINSTNTDLASINRIFIRQGSATDTPLVEMDELRIGLSWESVTGGIVWTGTAWTNGTGPTDITDASIDGVYDTALNGAFSVKNLTLSAGSLTVKSGTNITVTGIINNKLTADKFIVESNANLIQTGVATNIGNITVKRNTTIKRLDYTYWSSPVVGQTLANLSPATLPTRFYELNGANTFLAVASTTTMTEAKGYSVRAPNNFDPTIPAPFTANFIGKPTTGQQTISFTSTGSQYVLTGNPYPSTIDANVFLTTNPGSLHFWTHSVYQAGATNYATFTKIGGTISASPATTTPAVGDAPNGTIQVGQGFMYLPQSGDDIAVFENAMRVGNNANQFFRTAQNNSDKLWLNLSHDADFSQILVGYVPNATNGFDTSIDAKQINTGGLVLYSSIINNELAIQGRPTFNAADVVTLGYKSEKTGNQTLSIDHTEGVFSNGQTIYLKDNLTNVTHNLSNGAYTFATEIGTFNSRFTVVYSAALSNATNVFDANAIVVYNNANALNINSGNVQMKTVKVIDLQGRIVFERNNVNNNALSIDNFTMKNQVGIVQITSDLNEIVSKKVVF